MYILFLSSDNNKTSGAFLSMVYLNRILNEKFGIKTKVILPNKGNGEELLKSNNISYMLIPSYNWIVTSSEKNKLKNKIKFQIKKFLNIFALKKLINVIKENHVDVIHINTSYSYIGLKAGKKLNIPVVWHLREFLEEDQGREIYNKNYGYKLMESASRVIAISSQVYNKYLNIFRNNNLVTILNGIDTKKFYVPRREIFQTEKIKFIYGGGYSVRKGPFSLLSSLKLLIDFGIKNFEISFIGEPNSKFKAAVKRYGLDAYVKYLGYQSNVTQFYREADIAFSTSACEAFGRKTVEAMLAGCLIISSDTGGSLDIIKDGQTGIFYNEGNPIDLAFKIIYAIKNKKICNVIAQNGQLYAKENLSADTNADKIRLLYEEILKDE